MLSAIDNTLISVAQWIVRQIELFTPVTRKNLAYFLIYLYKWQLITFSVIFTFNVVFLSQHEISGTWYYILIFVNILIFFNLYNEVKKPILTDLKESVLPKEIVTRKVTRLIILGQFPLSLVIMITLVLLQIFFNVLSRLETITMVEGLSFLFILFPYAAMITQVCIEYFMCTVSLPPGEKEKKKVKKEMSQMIPVGAIN